MSWPAFAAIFVAFFLTHSLPVRPRIKARLEAALGQTGFTISYSAISLVMLGTLIFAAQNAPYIALWPQTVWHRYVVFLGMFLVCLIIAFAIGRPNPFSFGGARNESFDPSQPGIVRLSRHPLLLALSLWSALHLLPNGDLAHVVMFGVFLGFSILGRWIIDRRKQRLMGAGRWRALLEQTASAWVFPAPGNWRGWYLRAGAAIGAYVLLLVTHPLVIGVPALP